MNQNQYIGTPPTNTRKKAIGYGKAAGIVMRFLREQGVISTRNICIPAIALGDAVLRYRKQPYRDLGKGAAKELIVALAHELAGIDPAIAKKRPKAKRGSSRAVRVIATSGRTASPADFYWSEEWRRVRYAVLRKSRGVCELCCAAPTAGHPLHVDHIKPRSKFPELELDPANLQVLCEDCNLGKSNTDSIDWRQKAAG